MIAFSLASLAFVAAVLAWGGGALWRGRRRRHHSAPLTIVTMSGAIGSGKDTAADLLVASRGFQKLAFADALRDCGLVLLRRLLGVQDATPDLFTNRDLKDAPLAAYPAITPRAVLKVLGTDVIRDCVDSNTWVNVVLRKIHEAEQAAGGGPVGIVLSDARFPNELACLARLAGRRPNTTLITVKMVDADAVEEAERGEGESDGDDMAHVTETALDFHRFDHTVFNSKRQGTGALAHRLDEIVGAHGVQQ